MAVSQNGWPVSPVRSARIVPGTQVKLTVAAGPAGDVLMYVAEQFDRRVEDLDATADDWGYANRNIIGSTVTSNHASATAIDLNATRHPLGKRGTFDHIQVVTIHQILGEVDNVVAWGGDWSGRADEMHWEINAPESKVARVAQRLKAGNDVSAQEVWDYRIPDPYPGAAPKASRDLVGWAATHAAYARENSEKTWNELQRFKNEVNGKLAAILNKLNEAA